MPDRIGRAASVEIISRARIKDIRRLARPPFNLGVAYRSAREKSRSFFSLNINEVCIWCTWRVCIQVELVTGGLSPVCASCFTTSRLPSPPPSRRVCDPPPPDTVLRRRRRRRPAGALTILYDAGRLCSCDAAVTPFGISSKYYFGEF